MNITGFELYPLPFPFVSGGYTTSYGRRTRLNNLLLLVKADSDYVGLGEICRKAGNSPEPTSAAFSQRCSAILQAVVGADSLDLQSGLQAGRRSRDLAIEHGLKLKVDDCWSADVACAASLHLAMAVPPQQLIASVDMRPYFHGRISIEGPVCEAYRLAPNALPGLGLVADLAALGEPLR
jgi:hypothetical protein